MWSLSFPPRRRSTLLFGLLLVGAVACGGDSSTEPSIDEEFIGNWISTSFTVDGQELMTEGSSFYISLGLFSDGSYQLIVGGDESGVFCDGEPSCTTMGDYTFSGSTLTVDPGTPDAVVLQYAVSGDTLTVSGSIDGTPFSAELERL